MSILSDRNISDIVQEVEEILRVKEELDRMWKVKSKVVSLMMATVGAIMPYHVLTDSGKDNI